MSKWRLTKTDILLLLFILLAIGVVVWIYAPWVPIPNIHQIFNNRISR
jgi:hypothetical protein